MMRPKLPPTQYEVEEIISHGGLSRSKSCLLTALFSVTLTALIFVSLALWLVVTRVIDVNMSQNLDSVLAEAPDTLPNAR
jgi:hypothetical protein